MSMIVAEGILVKNNRERYCINDSVELTSGMVVEVSYQGEWIETSIEHDGEDYYFRNLPMVSPFGCRARLRKMDLF